MRCRMSGRFTPAAATLTRISLGFGAGLGRSAGFSTSGPPGRLISTARMAMALLSATRRSTVAQFRVEFVLDQSSGRYLAELYNPDNQQELIVRTEAMYPSQAAAVLGLVQLFKDAILQFPQPGSKPSRVVRIKPRGTKKKKAPAKKAKKKAKKKAARGRKGGRKHN